MRRIRKITPYGVTQSDYQIIETLIDADVVFLGSAPDLATAQSKRASVGADPRKTVVVFRLYRDRDNKKFILRPQDPPPGPNIQRIIGPEPQGLKVIGYDLFHVPEDTLSNEVTFDRVAGRIKGMLDQYGQQNDPSGVPPK